jgi:hypothetical protein
MPNQFCRQPKGLCHFLKPLWLLGFISFALSLSSSPQTLNGDLGNQKMGAKKNFPLIKKNFTFIQNRLKNRSLEGPLPGRLDREALISPPALSK